MITCTFDGGLGNNIFQLANIYNLHKKYNVDYEIPTYVGRNPMEKSQSLEFKSMFDNAFNYNDNITFNYQSYVHDDMKNDPIFHYKDIIFQDNTRYSGYFQSEKYFDAFDVKNEFVLNKQIVQEISETSEYLNNGKETISVHYRIGGNRSQVQHFFKNVSIEFYDKALALIDTDLSKYNLLLFSDDLEQAAPLFAKYKITPMPLPNNIYDFIYMSLCDYNIVGNSTFSWWAAYLNKKSKKIIAPKSEWFGPGYKHFILDDLFPKTWITL